MSTRQKINYSLGIARGGTKISVSFRDEEVDDDKETIASEYREAGWQVAVSSTGGQTTFEFQ